MIRRAFAEIASDLLILGGAGAVAVGAEFLLPGLGLVVGGIEAMALGFLIAPRPEP